MSKKIDKKIVAYEVVNLEEQRRKVAQEEKSQINGMHENVERPEMLVGATYKIKTPQSQHALYVTINDMVLNHGTEHEVRQPFEIFINSKNMDHFQWVVALTRVISAVFMPSIVAEIGFALESHMKMIGLLKEERMPEAHREMLQAKRAEYDTLNGQQQREDTSDFPPDCKLCSKCYTKAVIIMDGCLTCLNCGDSKCG
jgi:hypothetical protein